jgi:outer membrane protein TolC
MAHPATPGTRLDGVRGAVLVGLTVLTALASPAHPRAETLEDAWRLALAHDQTLAATAADLAAAREGERAASAARWPTLQANGSYTRFSTAPAFDLSGPTVSFQSAPLFDQDDYLTGGVQLSLPLYAGGRISAGIDAARHAVAGVEADERGTIAAVKLEVANAYVEVLRARRLLRTAESSVASLAAHVSDVGQMVERELVATSDLLAARVALANAEQARVRADNAVQIAYASYNRRIGEPLERAPDLDERLRDDSSLAAMPSVETLIERARASRSELKGLTAQADALEYQSRVERGALRPQLALTGQYSYLENEFLDRQDFSIVGVGLKWSLFDGGQTRHRAAALHNASRATRHRLSDLSSLIELEVRTAWLDVQAARARVGASGEAVAQAVENLRMSRELYGADLGTNTQVLDAVTLQITATNNHDDAVLDESLALLRLAHAVGEL